MPMDLSTRSPPLNAGGHGEEDAREWLVTGGALAPAASERHHLASAFGGTGRLYRVKQMTVVNNHGTVPIRVAPNGDAERSLRVAAGASRTIGGGDIEYLEITNLDGTTSLAAGDVVGVGEARVR